MAYRRKSRGRSTSRRSQRSFARRSFGSRSGGARRVRKSFGGRRSSGGSRQHTVRIEIHQPAAGPTSGGVVPLTDHKGNVTGFGVPSQPSKAKF